MKDIRLIGAAVLLGAIFFLVRTIYDFKRGRIVSRYRGFSTVLFFKFQRPFAFYATIIIHIIAEVLLLLYGIFLLYMGLRKS